MATFICMDGLGGRPEVTFRTLRTFLEDRGHTVIIAGVEKIQRLTMTGSESL